MKKGQGISLNTIIIAAIALIVLVVIIAVFTGRMGGWTVGLKNIVGDTNTDCNEINPSWVLRSMDDCNSIEGANHVRSKDAPGSTEMVCCTK
ncbi:hypothetical protein ACFLZX_01620 [Nanoarchaeota archaeon]